MATNAVSVAVKITPEAIILLPENCLYDESATAHTAFHTLKFNLLKAFYGLFRYCKKKGTSSYELAKEIGVSQPTA